MGPRGQRRQARAGFSVLEAMIALVITGLALTLIFSIGNRASSGGFNLGRRVLHLADNQIEALSFKALVEGLVVPSGLDKSRTGHGLDAEGQQNLTGSIHALSGSAVLGRDTPCAAAGPAAELSLSLKQTSNHWQLLCRADGGPQRLLMDLGHRAAQFSYSKDGRIRRPGHHNVQRV